MIKLNGILLSSLIFGAAMHFSFADPTLKVESIADGGEGISLHVEVSSQQNLSIGISNQRAELRLIYKCKGKWWHSSDALDFATYSDKYEQALIHGNWKLYSVGESKPLALALTVTHPTVLVSDSEVMQFDSKLIDDVRIILNITNNIWQANGSVAASNDLWTGDVSCEFGKAQLSRWKSCIGAPVALK